MLCLMCVSSQSFCDTTIWAFHFWNFFPKLPDIFVGASEDFAALGVDARYFFSLYLAIPNFIFSQAREKKNCVELTGWIETRSVACSLIFFPGLDLDSRRRLRFRKAKKYIYSLEHTTDHEWNILFHPVINHIYQRFIPETCLLSLQSSILQESSLVNNLLVDLCFEVPSNFQP